MFHWVLNHASLLTSSQPEPPCGSLLCWWSAQWCLNCLTDCSWFLISESALLLIFLMFRSDSTSLWHLCCASACEQTMAALQTMAATLPVFCVENGGVLSGWSAQVIFIVRYHPPGPDFKQKILVAMVILEFFCLCRLSLLSVTSRMFSTPWFMMARWRTLWRLGVAGLKVRMAGCTACWSPWSPPQDWWECPVGSVLWVKPFFSTLLACVSYE